MSLTPCLVDTYRQYKKGTGQIVQWLAETASKAAPVEQLLNKSVSCDNVRATGRLKGKARMQAQAQQSSSFYVPVKSFQPLADIIASAKVEVPNGIMSMLRDVISSRKECASFYKAQEDKNDNDMRQRNATHSHFITVLEDIRRTLKPLCIRKPEDEAIAGEVKVEAPDTLSNVFEHLKMEVTADDAVEAPQTLTKSTKKPSPVYMIEPSDEDTSFAIYCFLKDCTEVRLLVHRTWRQYKLGQIPLTVAATTANSSIEILRRLNNAFLDDFPDFDDHEKIIDFLYETHFSGVRDQPDEAKGRSGYYDIGEVQMMPQTLVCEVTTRVYFKWFLLAPSSSTGAFGAFGEYNAPTDDKCTIHGERLLILRLLTLFSFMDIGKFQDSFDFWRPDLLLEAVSATKRAGKPLTWAVFAVQSFVDMHRELETEVERGFRQLQHTAAWVKASMLHTLEVSKAGAMQFNMDTFHYVMHHITRLTEEDYTSECLITPMFHGNPEQLESVLAWGTNFMFKNHPMVCGLIEQHFLANLHDLTMEFEYLCGPVLGSIHFYNAALQHKLIPSSCVWADLEYIIAKIGEHSAFVGDRPRTFRDCFIHFCLALGISITHVTGTARNEIRYDDRGRLKSTRPRRQLAYISRYMQQIFGSEPKFNYRTKAKRKPCTRALFEPEAMLDMLVANSISRSRPASKQSRTALSPLETLSIFKDAMTEDAPALRFDMLRVLCRCVDFLRTVDPDKPGYVHESDFLHACLSSMDFEAPKEKLEAELGPVWWRMTDIIQTEGNTEMLLAEERLGIAYGPLEEPKESDKAATERVFEGVKKQSIDVRAQDWFSTGVRGEYHKQAMTPGAEPLLPAPPPEKVRLLYD